MKVTSCLELPLGSLLPQLGVEPLLRYLLQLSNLKHVLEVHLVTRKLCLVY